MFYYTADGENLNYTIMIYNLLSYSISIYYCLQYIIAIIEMSNVVVYEYSSLTIT